MQLHTGTQSSGSYSLEQKDYCMVILIGSLQRYRRVEFMIIIYFNTFYTS